MSTVAYMHETLMKLKNVYFGSCLFKAPTSAFVVWSVIVYLPSHVAPIKRVYQTFLVLALALSMLSLCRVRQKENHWWKFCEIKNTAHSPSKRKPFLPCAFLQLSGPTIALSAISFTDLNMFHKMSLWVSRLSYINQIFFFLLSLGGCLVPGGCKLSLQSTIFIISMIVIIIVVVFSTMIIFFFYLSDHGFHHMWRHLRELKMKYGIVDVYVPVFRLVLFIVMYSWNLAVCVHNI